MDQCVCVCVCMHVRARGKPPIDLLYRFPSKLSEEPDVPGASPLEKPRAFSGGAHDMHPHAACL